MAVGPLIRAALRAGVRYGPIVYGVVKKNREPAQAAYDRTTARVEARRIARQAAESGHSAAEEMLLLATHGMLHLLGYDHATDAEREVMFALQRKLLLTFLATR